MNYILYYLVAFVRPLKGKAVLGEDPVACTCDRIEVAQAREGLNIPGYVRREQAVALRINCLNCGSRPYTEFWFGGEVVASGDPAEGLQDDYARVWLKQNTAGRQLERWFHYAGCRRWMTVERDTLTNVIYDIS
jgi:heterotetrameric sarcosine oxidase delta subunit